ncbi:N-acetyltransferase family protein [Sphingomonas sp.]|uniref:GNAT family N-acetyltransferase n=1 Tax=Sphingomonas sp. TaxID=28214 RepID=UPI0038A50D3F
MDAVAIRDATPEDAEAVALIYAHHVLHGTASYDLIPPEAGEIRGKIERVVAAGWPFLVAELDGAVAGYAYATQFRDRDAYRFTAEDSIYIHPERMRRGLGKALLQALVDACAGYGFRTIIAVIGGAEPSSIALHEGFGFREAGRLTGVGWKHGRWLDSVYMQLELPSGAG